LISPKTYRIEKYLELLSMSSPIWGPDSPITIRTIANHLGFPIAVVRADISLLFSLIGETIIYVDDYFSDTELSMDFEEHFISGEYDDLPLASDYQPKSMANSITLSPEEQLVLKKFINENDISSSSIDFDNNAKALPYFIKKSYRAFTELPDLFQISEKIKMAIIGKKRISFDYSSSHNRGLKEKLTHISTTPLKIVYDNEENRYSLLAYNRKSYFTYNFEDIIADSLIIKNEPATPHNEKALMDMIPHVWKNAFSEKPTHVLIRFSESVYNQVYDDLYYRHPEELLSAPNNGYFYFEDDIQGIDAFRLWLRGYGHNAIILKPSDMAKSHIESLLEMLSYD